MKLNIYKYKILVLDFGSQYSKLIVRRIRKIGVYCELYKWNTTKKEIEIFCPNGIIFSGGPNNVNDKNSPYISDYFFKLGIPILGICYGMHIISVKFGGEVQSLNNREFGRSKIFIQNNCKLFNGIYDSFDKDGKKFLNVWMSHSDTVVKAPLDFKVIALSDSYKISIIANDKRKIYGVQFHPEVTQTKQGYAILERFVLDICNCKKTWNSKLIVDKIVENIKNKIKKDFVILGISGGIDSLISALLLSKAIGKRLICIFINNGLLRLGEAKEVLSVLKKNFNFNIIYVSAERRFLNALSGIYESELKRKIVGNLFIKIFEEEAEKIKEIKWLAQGTICSDVIESSSSKIFTSQTIKSHHNVGCLPLKMQLKLVEPLKNFFKDEVRKIGSYLGLSDSLLKRHPFPGPGLSIRILGEVKQDFCDLLRKSDSIFIEELHKENLYYKLNQAFAVFLPVKSVGVMGDSRKYDWIIALRAIKTVDFMTAEWAKLPLNFLDHVSNRIINEVNGISRVVYDITNKPPSTIEWE